VSAVSLSTALFLMCTLLPSSEYSSSSRDSLMRVSSEPTRVPTLLVCLDQMIECTSEGVTPLENLIKCMYCTLTHSLTASVSDGDKGTMSPTLQSEVSHYYTRAFIDVQCRSDISSVAKAAWAAWAFLRLTHCKQSECVSECVSEGVSEDVSDGMSEYVSEGVTGTGSTGITNSATPLLVHECQTITATREVDNECVRVQSQSESALNVIVNDSSDSLPLPVSECSSRVNGEEIINSTTSLHTCDSRNSSCHARMALILVYVM
jgi:hypothetical protein